MRNLLVAAAISFLAALGLHAYDCHFGTNEQCLISRGMLWVYWMGIFVIAGIPTALFVSAVQAPEAADQKDTGA